VFYISGSKWSPDLPSVRNLFKCISAWKHRSDSRGVSNEQNSSPEEDSGGNLELSDSDETSSSGRKLKQLCTDCGALYGARKSHTCQHKLKPHVYAHKQIHKNQSKPYQCRHCPSSFAIFAERTKHNKIHRGPFEYKCDICGISFWVKAYLERHMMVHTGVKPYKCSVCERSFNQDCNLRSHMRMHTGEKPYACPHCDKAFNHNVSLKSHVQRYHPSESETREDTSCVLKNRIHRSTVRLDQLFSKAVENKFTFTIST
uniref:C2H2-type domain-containing protein n=1 Tax=Neogobius melanostomus TaxID=47308 RepID=A0A8C6WTI7_9GOBI